MCVYTRSHNKEIEMTKKTTTPATATATTNTAANMASLQRSMSLLATRGEELPTSVRRWHEARVARLQRAVYRPRRK